MTVFIRSKSLIRGKVNEQTNDVYASRSSSSTTKRNNGVASSSSTTTLRTLSSSLSSSTRSSLSLSSSKGMKGNSSDNKNNNDTDHTNEYSYDDLVSFLGHETPLFSFQQEVQGIKEMIQQFTNTTSFQQIPDPQMYIRYYRAAKGNVTLALQQMHLTLQWRKEFGVNALCHSLSSSSMMWSQVLVQENATGKIYVRGYDKQGRALVYMRPARENTSNEINQIHHLVWNLEKAIACTRRESKQRIGKTLEKIILLIDYEGFTMANAPPMSTTKATLHILQNMYPERMYRAFCLHPPFLFRAFWNMVRPFIDPVTKEKIVFVNTKSIQHKQVWSLMNHPEQDLETGAGGKLAPNDFDSYTYLHLPFDQAYPTTH